MDVVMRYTDVVDCSCPNQKCARLLPHPPYNNNIIIINTHIQEGGNIRTTLTHTHGHFSSLSLSLESTQEEEEVGIIKHAKTMAASFTPRRAPSHTPPSTFRVP